MGRGDTFGTLLRHYRTAAGLTQEELAERAGYSTVYIGMLERSRRSPLPATARLLAGALALTPRDRVLLEAAAMPEDSTAPPLVGRVRELALLDRHLGGEGPPLLLLAGEPGIGKSRLLQEAARRATGGGWSVLQGGCRRRDGEEPFAPVIEALQQHIESSPQEQVAADLDSCAWLARLLPELADRGIEPPVSWTLSPSQERRLIFGAVDRYLTNVAGPVGTVLLLDDLHWAGSDALDLLTVLVRRRSETPLRLVGAYRDTEAGPQSALARLLADLAHAGSVVHHTVSPLTEAETGRLLDRLLQGWTETSSVLRRQAVEQADGVPFYIVSWAQQLHTHGGNRADAIPWDIAQSVRQRVASLPERGRQMLRVAAVSGRTVSLPVLCAVTGQSEVEMAEAIESACAEGLLQETGHQYRFVHDVIREIVEADTGTAGRVALHGLIAEALESMPGEPPVESLAYHYARSTSQGKAAEYLDLAGDRAMARSANAAAEQYYRSLADCLESLSRPLDAARAREKLGMALVAQIQHDRAQEELERAAELHLSAADLDGVARVTAHLASIYRWKRSTGEGIERVLHLLPALEAAGPSPGLAWLHLALSQLCFSSGRHSEGLRASEQASDIARILGDSGVLARAEMGRGHAHRVVGHGEEAQSALETAARLAEAAGDARTLCFALDGLVSISLTAGDFDRARMYNARAFDLARRLGDPQSVAIMTSVRGYIAFLAGNWEEARHDLEEAAAMYRDMGDSWLTPWELGTLCLAEGDWEAGVQYLQECVVMAEASGDVHALRQAQMALAEWDLLQARPEEAHARLVPLLDQPGLEEGQVTMLLPVLAWALLDMNRVLPAEETVDRAIERARAQNHQLALVDAERILALVKIQQECWGEAEHALEDALGLARTMRYSYAEARVLLAYGTLHRRRRDPLRARQRFADALRIFERLRAQPYAERTKKELKERGEE